MPEKQRYLYPEHASLDVHKRETVPGITSVNGGDAADSPDKRPTRPVKKMQNTHIDGAKGGTDGEDPDKIIDTSYLINGRVREISDPPPHAFRSKKPSSFPPGFSDKMNELIQKAATLNGIDFYIYFREMRESNGAGSEKGKGFRESLAGWLKNRKFKINSDEYVVGVCKPGDFESAAPQVPAKKRVGKALKKDVRIDLRQVLAGIFNNQ